MRDGVWPGIEPFLKAIPTLVGMRRDDMAKKRASLAVLEIFDARPLAKSSRLRYGSLETRGVPSILFGVAAIVLAVGASKTLQRGASALPETLREARLFWTAIRPGRPELRDDFSNAAGR